MASHDSSLVNHEQGGTNTSNHNGPEFLNRIVIPIIRVNHVLLVPWIVLSIPSVLLIHQQILLVAVLILLGLAGMLTGTSSLATAASVSLLGLLVWGKVGADLYGLNGPDSAIFLLQFMLVILLMEASKTELVLDKTFRQLKGQNDEISKATISRASIWAATQLVNLAKLTTASFLLSLTLLIFASIVSVSVNQIAFSGGLVMAAVVALLLLLTYKREPERQRTNTHSPAP